MILPEKVAQLKHAGLSAVRLAMLWEDKIAASGVKAAEDFYLSLGHNHIERKGVEWEGLTLSREPKEHEKIAVKGVSQAQESAKTGLINLLLGLRTELISNGLKGIQDLSPGTYHKLILDTPAEFRPRLRDRLIEVYREGRELIIAELNKQGKGLCPIDFKQDDDEDEFDELDDLTDLTDARVANDVQSRITAAATRFALLGLAGAALLSAISGEVESGSTGYIDRAAAGAANKVINFGRAREAILRRDQWGTVEYSAILDQNVCGPCASEDGTTARDESDLQPAPNPECEGSDYCRCFHVFVQV